MWHYSAGFKEWTNRKSGQGVERPLTGGACYGEIRILGNAHTGYCRIDRKIFELAFWMVVVKNLLGYFHGNIA